MSGGLLRGFPLMSVITVEATPALTNGEVDQMS